MRNAGLDDSQAGIKIARRNINNLRYADDTPLMVESDSFPHTSPSMRMFKFWKESSHLLMSPPITMVTGPRVVSVETEAEQ